MHVDKLGNIFETQRLIMATILRIQLDLTCMQMFDFIWAENCLKVSTMD